MTRLEQARQQVPAAQGGQSGERREDVRLPLAPRWRRLLGFVLDCLILTLLTGALWGRLIASFANRLARYQSSYPDSGTSSAHAALGRVFTQTTGPFLIELCFTICVAVLYYWLLTAYWGTTIGKRWAGVWVVTARDQSRVSMTAAFLRALVFVVGAEVVPLFFLVDNLWLLWDQRRQCLHDKLARTIVVTTAASRRSSSSRRRGISRRSSTGHQR